jgi:hypothetical protein
MGMNIPNSDQNSAPNSAPNSAVEAADARKRIIRGRNRVLGVLLLGLAVLIFAISIAKMG